MNTRYYWLLTLALCSSNTLMAADTPGRQAPRAMARPVQHTHRLSYLAFLPQDYGKEPGRKWPMILFLHGMGERGDNLQLVKRHGPPKLVDSRPDFPFVVISPQCPLGTWWQTEPLLALLDEVIEKYEVDPRRVYLTGLSMGGFGTWSLALAAPERFAAIAPICGGGNPYPPVGFNPDRLAALRTLPIWVFHGAKDTIVNPAESERMVQGMRRYGCTVDYTVYPEAGHDAWTETYDNPRLFEWFLEHQRPLKVNRD